MYLLSEDVKSNVYSSNVKYVSTSHLKCKQCNFVWLRRISRIVEEIKLHMSATVNKKKVNKRKRQCIKYLNSNVTVRATLNGPLPLQKKMSTDNLFFYVPTFK